MPKIILRIDEERRECEIIPPTPAEPMKFTAAELENFMRQLAAVRATMKPAVESGDMTPKTLYSSVACLWWHCALDPDAPTQIRLYLLHQGFGWVWIPLREENVKEMESKMQEMLHLRPRLS